MATKRKFEIGDVVMVKSTGEVFEIKRYDSPHYVVDGGRCYTAVQLEKAGDENFKYGDRVRVLEDTFSLRKGDVGKIIAGTSDGQYLFESDEESPSKHHGHKCDLLWGRIGDPKESRCGWVYPDIVEKIEDEKQEEKNVKQKEVKVKDKFKLGDRVVCKTKDAYGFSVGETGTITAKTKGVGQYLVKHDVPNRSCHMGAYTTYEWGKASDKSDCTLELDCDFELIKTSEKKEEIHITRKGREVHAILKKDGKLVKRTVAKCHPDDEFDFETGAKLAMNRLYGEEEHETIEEKMEMKPSKYRVGDMVLLKTKEELIKEFGTLYGVYPACIEPMEDKLGKVLTLEPPKNYKYPVETFLMPNTGGCVISDQYIKGKIVKCDKYQKGDIVLVKSKEEVKKEGLSREHPYFVKEMERFCGKLIKVLVNDVYFRYMGFTWSPDFIVGKVVE